MLKKILKINLLIILEMRFIDKWYQMFLSDFTFRGLDSSSVVAFAKEVNSQIPVSL